MGGGWLSDIDSGDGGEGWQRERRQSQLQTETVMWLQESRGPRSDQEHTKAMYKYDTASVPWGCRPSPLCRRSAPDVRIIAIKSFNLEEKKFMCSVQLCKQGDVSV